jgi:hypothetical protein
MRLVFIICETGVEAHVIEIIEGLGASGYTRFTGAVGDGRHGRREGTPVWPGLNSLVMVAVPDELINPLMTELDKLRAARGGRLALKAFSAAVEDHL